MVVHKYVKSGKFKNVNCGYALVQGRIVFGSVFDAEEYCSLHDLDPDVWIEADDPAVLKRCQEIARATLPALALLKGSAHGLCEYYHAEIQRKCNARDAAKAKHELGWEIHEEWVAEAVGKSQGGYECMALISDYMSTLSRIYRMKHTQRGEVK